MRRTVVGLAVLVLPLAVSPSSSAAACMLETLRTLERFSTVIRMADAAGLGDCFAEEASGTFFAPTNEAFDRLDEGVVDRLTEPENSDELELLIEHHLAPGVQLSPQELQSRRRLEMAEGEPILVGPVGDKIRIGDANIIEFDVATGASTIHAIDEVLVPEIVWNMLERSE